MSLAMRQCGFSQGARGTGEIFVDGSRIVQKFVTAQERLQKAQECLHKVEEPITALELASGRDQH
ncbi:hypothetical protein BGZ65_010581, partial [Modicella reniformis]